jgi:GT2 family glycosyltransferase
MTPDTSVIIVTWNGKHFLEACLSALAAQEGVTFETIVVDNGSEDGTADFVRERFPSVRVVALAKNLGFAGGNNVGAAAARGRYVAFLNNDTVPQSGWLRALRAGVDEHASFALTTSRIVYMHDPTTIDSAGDGVLRWGGAFKRHHGAQAHVADESTEVFAVCGAACLMSRTVFEELGGFDEDFFASHEDVDLSYRAQLRGYRCRYVADAVVRHHGSATMGKVSEFAVFHGQRNLEWMYFKNAPASVLLRSLPGHVIYNAAAALHFARLGLFGTFVRAKIAALSGARQITRKRASVQRTRRVPARAIWERLEPRWLELKRREKQFDMRSAAGAR